MASCYASDVNVITAPHIYKFRRPLVEKKLSFASRLSRSENNAVTVSHVRWRVCIIQNMRSHDNPCGWRASSAPSLKSILRCHTRNHAACFIFKAQLVVSGCEIKARVLAVTHAALDVAEHG